MGFPLVILINHVFATMVGWLTYLTWGRSMLEVMMGYEEDLFSPMLLGCLLVSPL